MYFGCPLLRALNNDGKNVLFPGKATGMNYPRICVLSCVIAAAGRPRFAVSHRLFAACPRAKPSELRCSLRFGAHYSLSWVGKFCSLMKMWAPALHPKQNEALSHKGWPQGGTAFTTAVLLGRIRAALTPRYLAEQFAAACRSLSAAGSPSAISHPSADLTAL